MYEENSVEHFEYVFHLLQYIGSDEYFY